MSWNIRYNRNMVDFFMDLHACPQALQGFPEMKAGSRAGMYPDYKTECKCGGHVLVIALLLFFSISGCAVYHPMPLDRGAIDRALAPPGADRLKVEAASLCHPIIKPLLIDLKDGLSPDEAAVLAVLANPRLRAVRDEQGIASAQVLQAGILPNPVLSAGFEIPTGGVTSNTFNAYNIQPDWEITALIDRSARMESASAAKRSVDLMVAWKEWQVAEAARLHCIRLMWCKKKVALLKNASVHVRENLARIKMAMDLGEKTAVDLAAAEAAWQWLCINLARTEQELEQERLALNRCLGLPPDRIMPIQYIDFTGETPAVSPESIVKRLERTRLDLVALKMGYQSQEAALRAAVLSQFPRIGIGIPYARDTGNVLTTGVAITMEIPFFERNQGDIAMARAIRKKLFDEYVSRLFEARSEVSGIFKKMASVRDQIEATQKAVEAQGKLVETYRRALEQGNADILSYYQARNELTGKRMELLTLKEGLSDLEIALESASGRYFPLTGDSSSVIDRLPVGRQ